jgi:hypothetical protein
MVKIQQCCLFTTVLSSLLLPKPQDDRHSQKYQYSMSTFRQCYGVSSPLGKGNYLYQEGLWHPRPEKTTVLALIHKVSSSLSHRDQDLGRKAPLAALALLGRPTARHSSLDRCNVRVQFRGTLCNALALALLGRLAISAIEG